MQFGSYDRMIDNSVRFYTGYIQVHKNGYWEDRVIDNSFTYDQSLAEKMLAIDAVESYIPRMESFALAAFENQTKGALVMGVDPELENELTKVKDKLVKGTYLNKNDDGVLIAEGLARYLGVKLGDTLDWRRRSAS
jgi:ABC-type lipoprotein release transport system permease subunit